MVRAQFKIQQMIFMILAVFLFFILAGLFFINIQLRSLRGRAVDIKREKTVSSLKAIIDMPELSWTYRSYCNHLCLDEDKVAILSGYRYEDIWPVESLEIRKVYPYNEEEIKCPAENCNFYELYNSGRNVKEKYATYVSLCKRIGDSYDKCEIAKLIAGVKE